MLKKEAIHRHRIVFVEGRTALQKIVRGVGAEYRPAFEVLPALTGQALLDVLYDEQTPNPTMILLDLNVSDMKCRALLEEIQKTGAFSNIPIIVLLDIADQGCLESLRAAGVKSFYKKSSDLFTFRRIVNKIIDDWVLESENNRRAKLLIRGSQEGKSPVAYR